MTEASINFIHSDISNWKDVAAESGRNLSLKNMAPRIRLGREIWLVQAFHLLRERGLPVRLSGTYDPRAINVAHYDDIVGIRDLWRYFLVSVRADREPCFSSQLEVVQNEWSVWSNRDFFIPHWPQPGLITRRKDRGDKIENIVFMGKADNLAESFKSEEFRESLRKLGMSLIIRESDWWDYSDADVVLAVRGGTQFLLSIKPASKLVNAWSAGCPAILSPEIGYMELRRSKYDFLEATTPETVLTMLSTLKDSPQLVREMISNGHCRAQEFTTSAIMAIWESFLCDVAQPEFDTWRNTKGTISRKQNYLWGQLRNRIWGYWSEGKQYSNFVEGVGRLRRMLACPGLWRR